MVLIGGGGGKFEIELFVRLLTETIPGVAVPVFYVISGYLFFFKHEFTVEQYKKQNIKRIKTLWVPYLLWNLIALIAIRLIPSFLHVTDIFSYIQQATLPSLIRDVVAVFGIHGGLPVDGPLYFIRNLIIMCVLSPIIYWIIKRVGFMFVVFLLLFWIIQNIFILEPWGSMSKAVTFFTLGSYIGIKKPNIRFVWNRGNVFVSIFLIISVVDSLLYSGVICEKGLVNEYLYKVIVTLGVVVCFYIASMVKNIRYTKFNNTVFFIYASHLITLTYLYPVIKHLYLQNNLFFYIVTYFTLLIASIFSTMCIYGLCKRYMPAVAEVLSGNRK